MPVFEHIDMQLLAACLIQPECAVKIFTSLRLEKRIQKKFYEIYLLQSILIFKELHAWLFNSAAGCCKSLFVMVLK